MDPLAVVDGLDLAARAVDAARRLHGERPRATLRPPPLAFEVRYERFVAFRQAVVRTVSAADVLTSQPHALVGALWSLPTLHRAVRDIQQYTQDALAEFAEVVAIGSPETVEAAARAFDQLGDLLSAIDTSRSRPLHLGPGRKAQYPDRRIAVMDAVRRFSEANQRELTPAQRRTSRTRF